jgi:hypothetical protein
MRSECTVIKTLFAHISQQHRQQQRNWHATVYEVHQPARTFSNLLFFLAAAAHKPSMVLRLLQLLTSAIPTAACSLFQEVHADLAKAAKQGKGAAVKVAAAEALALCCFVAAEDEHTTLEVMEQLHGLWGKGVWSWFV